jgi:hypothetical protein
LELLSEELECHFASERNRYVDEKARGRRFLLSMNCCHLQTEIIGHLELFLQQHCLSCIQTTMKRGYSVMLDV